MSAPYQGGRRYKILNELGAGGMGAVYRAYDRLMGHWVAIKRVTTPASHITFSTRDSHGDGNLQIALAQEFKILGSLRHPNIISVLDYGFDSERQPYVVMELLEESSTLKQAAQDRSVQNKVDLLIQVLQALAYLHRRGILHRDLKPANVMVVDGRVKVLDFGIAVMREQIQGDQIAGTLAYMAPEVIKGGIPTEASDLYAVGVMAYELFSGRHPFDTSDSNRLIGDILTSEPDMTPLKQVSVADVQVPVDDATVRKPPGAGSDLADTQAAVTLPASGPDTLMDDGSTEVAPTLPARRPENRPPAAADTRLHDDITIDALSGIVQKLLVKQPDARFQAAADVIAALCKVTGHPLPEETAAIRESFIQAARFVGRDNEIQQLSQILEETVGGAGSAWLIAGESGVGKSRLVDELRIQALVKGMLVLRGQAVSEGGARYQLWRDILPLLVLYTDLTDEEASILKPYISDMSRILDQEIADPPPADPQQAQIYLVQTLNAILGRIDVPVLLIFEDLQWAGTESLTLMERLGRVVNDRHLLFLGTYRSDERPDLPETLLAYQVMELRRLSPVGIADLSTSILGKAGRDKAVLDLLERETEGNAFFLVEVVRALAERVGSLDEVVLRSLPERVFAGGIQQIVEQRLSRISEESHSLLELAAIAGRVFDLKVLEGLHKNGHLDIWIRQWADAAVVEFAGGNWQFSHDKLREVLLDTISIETKPGRYQQVAEIVEGLYPDDPGHAASLAHLWQIAGHAEKEHRYARTAGELALQNNASPEAWQYFDRALELLKEIDGGEDPAVSTMLLHLLRSASITFTAGYTHGGQEVSLSTAYAMGDALKAQGADVITLQSIILASLSLYHLVKSVSDENMRGTNKDLNALAGKASDPISQFLAYSFSGWEFLYGDFATALDNLEEAWDLYQPDVHQPLLFQLGVEVGNLTQIALGFAHTLLGYPDKGRAHIEPAFEIADELGHYFTLGLSWSQFSILDSIVLDLDGAADKAQKSLGIGTEYNFPNFISHPLVIQGYVRALQGQPDAEAISLIERGLEVDRMIGTRIWRPFHLGQLAEVYLLAEEMDDAQDTISMALEEVEETSERFAEAELNRIQGQILLTNGDESGAEAAFQKAAEIARKQDAKWWELRASTSLARLWRSQGKTADAQARLSDIYGWFTEGFDLADLKVAKSLLDELEV